VTDAERPLRDVLAQHLGENVTVTVRESDLRLGTLLSAASGSGEARREVSEFVGRQELCETRERDALIAHYADRLKTALGRAVSAGPS